MAEETQQPAIKELQEKLDECAKLRDEYLTGWQRQKADFLNFKKDQEKFLEHFAEITNEKLLRDLLSFADTLHLSAAHLPESLKENEWAKGVLQSISRFFSFLKSVGLEEIETIGKHFNPEFHESVQEVEDSGKESDTIIEEVQKGYMLRGKVIRPAKVKIVK